MIAPKRFTPNGGLLEPDFGESPDSRKRSWGASWVIHVSAILLVQTNAREGRSGFAVPLALDPLLFGEPVELRRWHREMRRSDALMVQSGPECFMMRSVGRVSGSLIIDQVETDDHHSRTTAVLGTLSKDPA